MPTNQNNQNNQNDQNTGYTTPVGQGVTMPESPRGLSNHEITVMLNALGANTTNLLQDNNSNRSQVMTAGSRRRPRG